MNRKIRIFLLAFIALSIISLVVLVSVHYRTQNSYKVVLNEDKRLEVKIDKVHYSGTRDGRVEWELTADSARRSKDEDLTVLDAVEAKFFSRSGVSYTLTANEGRFREAAGEIYAYGDVKVLSGEGYTLESVELKYSIKQKEITSAEKVVFKSGNMDIEGYGLFVDIEGGRVLLNREVKAVFRGNGAT